MNAQQRRKQKREKESNRLAVKQFQKNCKHNGPSKCSLCGKTLF